MFFARGSRVALTENHRCIGTVTGAERKTGKIFVHWDKKRGTMLVDRASLIIIGFDPRVGSKDGIWRARDKKNRIWRYMEYAF